MIRCVNTAAELIAKEMVTREQQPPMSTAGLYPRGKKEENNQNQTKRRANVRKSKNALAKEVAQNFNIKEELSSLNKSVYSNGFDVFRQELKTNKDIYLKRETFVEKKDGGSARSSGTNNENKNTKPRKKSGWSRIVWNRQNETKLDVVFRKFDQAGRGTLTFADIRGECLKQCIQLIGHNPTDADISDYLKKIDKNGDGIISKEELKTFVQEIWQGLGDPREALRAAVDVVMRHMDRDGNGYVSKQEFRLVMKQRGSAPLTDDEVDELFSLVDLDGDQTTLNKEELMRVLELGLYSVDEDFSSV